MKREQSQAEKIMLALIDKLCDHLTNDKVKSLIDHGFDEWETISYLKGEELVQMGFTSQECIIIMVAINSNAKEFNIPPIFSEQTIKKVLQKAKQHQSQTLKNIQQQQMSHKNEAIGKHEQNEQKPSSQQQPNQQPPAQQFHNEQFPSKEITQQLLLKGVRVKQKPGEKINLGHITLINLEQKQITHIRQMNKVPILLNLYLNKNNIMKIEGLEGLKKLKVLKIDGNRIRKIQHLEQLVSLEQLFLNDNYIDRLQNLFNKNLMYLNISNQKSNKAFTFDRDCCQCLGYSLQHLECDRNRIKDIRSLSELKVISRLQLRHNLLEEIGELSETLSSLQRLKYLDFRGNPIASVPKYRDYIVILSKSLQQLDDKKILPTERQYLVKLYSLKHAKQVKEEGGAISSKNISTPKQLDLQGKKVEESAGQPQYTHGGDLRGNVAYHNTKITKK